MSKIRIGSWVLALGFLATGAFAQQKVYWVGIRTVYRANLDGTEIETLVTLPLGNGFADIEIDTVRGKMYWSNPAANKIHRANLDGSELEDIVTTGLENAAGLAIDVLGGTLYWANRAAGMIERSDLAGSNRELVLETHGASKLALDVSRQHLYWVNSFDRVLRADVDGGNIVELYDLSDTFPSDLNVRGLALDLQHGKVYFGFVDTNFVIFTGNLLRAELDGSGYEEIVEMYSVTDIATDAAAGKVYWSRPLSVLQRANVGGSSVEILVDWGGKSIHRRHSRHRA